jgi:hypothetical protein
MTTSEYIGFNIDLGFKIIEASSVNWLINDNGYAHSFPTLHKFNPEKTDIDLALKSGCRFLLFRGDTPVNNTFEYVYKGDRYDLEMFDSKIRNQIRKGISSCIIRDVDYKSITTKGLDINIQTLNRQKRKIAYLTDKEKWNKYIANYLNKKDIYIKGAYANDELIGYVIFIKLNDSYIIQHPFRNDVFSSLNPMNAILYNFINEIISTEKYIEITYGLASFEETHGLDKFKKGMLFSELPASRLAILSPFYSFIFNYTLSSFLRFLNKLNLINSKDLSVYYYLLEANQLYKKYYNEI